MADFDIQAVSTLTPEQRRLLRQIIGYVGPEVGQGLNLPEGVGEVPGLSPLQQQALQQIGGFDASGQGGLRDQRLQAIQGLTGFGGTAGGQFDEAVALPTVRQFQTETVPFLAERFAGTGAGGALAGELGRAGRDLGTNLAAQRGLFLAQDRQLGLQGLQSGLSGLQTLQTEDLGRGLLPIQLGLAGGGLERAVAAEESAGGLNRFLLQHPAFNPALGLLSPALGTQAKQSIAAPASGGNGGGIGGLIGGIGGGLLGFGLGGPAGALLGYGLGSGLGGGIGGLL